MAKNRALNRRIVIVSAFGAGIILLLIVWLVIGQDNKPKTIIPSRSPTSTSSQTQTSSNNDKQNGAVSTSTNSSSATSTPSSSTTSGTALMAPFGSFVSNHNPGQNGSPTTEESVCNTTPGAACYIKFTQGSLTRSLKTEVADKNGVVIWDWDIKQAGINSGEWQVTAVTELNSQTKSTTDPLLLKVL